MTRLNGKLSSTTFALIMARCLLLSLAMLTVLSGCFQPTASAQQFTGTYLRQIGTPTSVSPHPVELGYINLGNGILHLEIPLGSFPQRGSTAPLTFKLIYDSRIWQHFGPSSVWDFQNVKNIKGQNSWGGWRFQDSSRGWLEIDTSLISSCVEEAVLSWHSVDGSQHFFDVTPFQYTSTSCGTIIPYSGSGPSIDATGFLYSVTNFQFGSSSPQGTVLARNGSQIFPTPTDTNGNAYSVNANGDLVDTLGRVPVQTTTNCNNNPNQICYDVLNSESAYTQGSSPQGTRSRYTVTLSTTSVNTAFGESEVTECSSSCSFQVISSIALPDGTSYSFGYDSGTTAGNYGELTSVTFPTGGTTNYTYTTYEDLNGNRNRWVNSYSRSVDNGSSWTFTPQVLTPCSTGAQNCQQQLTVTSPALDKAVYNFMILNGAWKSSERVYTYSGNPTSLGTLVKTETTNYIINNPCPFKDNSCTESAVISEADATTTFPTTGGGTIAKKTQLNFANPQNGNVTSISEWMFHSGSLASTPDRATYISYLSDSNSSYLSANILDRPVSVVVCNPASGTDSACGGAGTPLAKTLLGYDSTTPAGVHGNLSRIDRWLSGGNDPITTLSYDNYGNLTQIKDPNNNITTLGYADRFFMDSASPSNPPGGFAPSQAANAYPTSLTLPIIGTANFGYYYGSGKLASAVDQNGADSYLHFSDSGLLDRLTHTYGPSVPIGNTGSSSRPWTLAAYLANSEKQVDSFVGIGDASPSTTCSSCRHDQTITDNLGRLTTNTLVNDPDGSTSVNTAYDSEGRTLSVTHPQRSVANPTDGSETFSYDGLNRTTAITHSDGSSAMVFHGAAVTQGGGGLSAQQCSSCGVGYPTLTKDESGLVRQTWTDGFGRVIEVDEPGSGSGAAVAGTGSVTIGGSEQATPGATPGTGSVSVSTGTATGASGSGTVSVTVNGFTATSSYIHGTTPACMVQGLVNGFNSSSSPVRASNSSRCIFGLASSPLIGVHAATLSLVAKSDGTSTNYSLSANATSGSGVTVTPSGSALTGGTGASGKLSFTILGSEKSTTVNGTTVYDAGTVSMTVNGFTATAAFGQPTTTSAIAQNLANVFNNGLNSPVMAVVSGSVITLTSKTFGPTSNFPVVINSAWDNTDFSKPSFTATQSATTAAGGTVGTVTIGGSEQCNPAITPYPCDTGTVWVSVNGFTVVYQYGQGSTPATIASNLASSSLLGSSSSPVTATAGGSVVTLRAKTTAQYSVSTLVTWVGPLYYANPSFTATPSGYPLSGGTSGNTTYDAGTVSVTVNGFVASASYGQTDTTASVASAIANIFNTTGGSPVAASVSGATVNLIANTTGSATNYSISSASSNNQPLIFTNPSFTVTQSAPTLTWGIDAGGRTLTSPSTTTYMYDLLGNLLQVSQGAQTRGYAYDTLSRVTSITTPETGPSTSATGTTNIYYTTSSGTLCAGDTSLPCRVIDPRNITATFSYDALNRLTSKAYSDGTTPSVAYCYDNINAACVSGFSSSNGIGRRTAMKDGSGSTAWSYDAAGRIVTEQQTIGAITKLSNYSYNLDDSIASVTYPHASGQTGHMISYTIRNAQRPTSAIDSASGVNIYATNAVYGPIGALTSVVHGNPSGGFTGITETYAYNNRLVPTSAQATSTAGTALSLTYGFFSNNNLSGIGNNSENVSEFLTYDAAGRILSAQQGTSGANCWGLNFGIDPIGNLTSETTSQCSANQLSVGVNAKNQITNSGFSYDLAGDLTGDGSFGYSYDAEGQLKSAGSVNYSYDGDGLRVQKSNGTMYWRSITGDTLAESDLSGNVTNEYMYFGGRMAARRDSSANVYFFFADHLGSTRVVTNSAGSPCYEADYYPYGGELTPSGFTNTCPVNYRFTGYERDPETGLDYAIARYYNNRIGRFMSPDPMESGENGYTYVENNPLSLVDPLGLDPTVFQFWAPTNSVNVFGGWGAVFAGLGGFSGAPGPIYPNLINTWTFHGFNPCPGGCSLGAALSAKQSPAAAPPMPQIGSWSFSLEGSGSALWNETKGLWDATGSGLFHPINTAVGIMTLAAALPGPCYCGDFGAQMQIYDAASAWGNRLASYDPRAFGQLVGTGALLASPFAKANGSFINVRAYRYPGAGGFGIEARGVSNPKNFFRFDMHRLHFSGRPISLVPHLDFQWSNLFKFKHFPWKWLQ